MGLYGGELRNMFLPQGCRHRRKGKRLYKGTCLEKQAGLPRTFNKIA
jgi:hypothetical protein